MPAPMDTEIKPKSLCGSIEAAEAAAAYNTPKAATKSPKEKPQETREERIARLQNEMKQAAANFDFILAAQLRDELLNLTKDKG